MIRGTTALWVFLVLAVSVGMFLMKFQVQNLEDRLAGLNRDIHKTHNEIRVLSAEWAYLNDPARIADLASRLLGLGILDGQAMAQIADLPLQQPENPAHQGTFSPTLANHSSPEMVPSHTSRSRVPSRTGKP
ncbi:MULTISPECIES: hypothetical protein [unclassified Haematospirillum]|uniref:cell division protein FtsL n=1 Tax=unclassified Haematospirillum TaxID=2622088 RepID=UPI00143A3A53|nr:MULTISPECIES: hypothetical protein [unclassified Haematospirillum]NKD54796.1 hypothetical protein [Haematospirillum sp. H4890]NKD74634.1 hypothetical protein [Haematospirillum sp. H4485]NKD87480.1 hypothetical protein [Haematospirillum sp. 15-248]